MVNNGFFVLLFIVGIIRGIQSFHTYCDLEIYCADVKIGIDGMVRIGLRQGSPDGGSTSVQYPMTQTVGKADVKIVSRLQRRWSFQPTAYHTFHKC